MANIAETPVYTANVYELSTTDPVEGGPGGISNAQAQALANRTAYLKAVLDAMWPPYSIREVDVPAASLVAYKAANFDGTGLGLSNGLWPGYAICNGANGTIDRGGRVAVGDGNGYTTGQTGGSKDAVVVSHSHGIPALNVTLPRSEADNGESDGNRVVMSDLEPAGSFTYNGAIPAGNTGSSGVSGTDKNMQPYLVTLFLMKL